MAYRVVYGEDSPGPLNGKLSMVRTALLTVMVFAVFLGGVYKFWPQGAQIIDKLGYYEGWKETGTALELMIIQLRSGEDLKDAVAAFCRDVVNIGMTYAS